MLKPIAYCLLIFSIFGAIACHEHKSEVSITPSPAGYATVIWISIDGLRHDYIDRVKPPTLLRLEHEGAYTNQEMPIFPSLTFPNHTAQVTGKYVDGHGIPANGFYDPDTKLTYNLPDESSLPRAETIWLAAKRQGLRTAVIAWPMSHQQTGPWKADYFDEQYNKKETDDQRLDRVLATLKADPGNPPMRLVLSYLWHLDSAGHSYGPDAPQVDQALREIDASLGRFIAGAQAWFDQTHAPTDELYVILTTDHGMENVHTPVNLDRLLGGKLLDGVKLVPSGPIATIHLLGVPADEKAARAAAIVAKLQPNPFLQVWQAKDVPAKYHFSDPTRVGDVVVLLAPGYTFVSLRAAATQPVSTLKGNHGYDPAVSENMLGSAIVWRYRHPLGGRDLGPIDNPQWCATVAKLLAIDPPAGADPRAIDLSH